MIKPSGLCLMIQTTGSFKGVHYWLAIALSRADEA